MYGIYYFENKNCFEQNFREELRRYGVMIDYEQSLNRLLTKIKNFMPSVIFLSYESTFLDEIFENLFSKDSEFSVPFVIIIKNQKTKINLENCAVILKDDKQMLAELLEQARINSESNNCCFKKDFQLNKINDLVFNLGFSNKLNGTIFLKDAIKFYCLENLRSTQNISIVYEKVSAFHQTSIQNVERCLRSATNFVWNNNIRMDENLKFFVQKPSNKELIRTLSEYILNDEKEKDVNNTKCINI